MELQNFDSSIVACACVYTSRKMLKIEPIWNESLELLTCYKESNLSEVSDTLISNLEWLNLDKEIHDTSNIIGPNPFKNPLIDIKYTYGILNRPNTDLSANLENDSKFLLKKAKLQHEHSIKKIEISDPTPETKESTPLEVYSRIKIDLSKDKKSSSRSKYAPILIDKNSSKAIWFWFLHIESCSIAKLSEVKPYEKQIVENKIISKPVAKITKTLRK